MLNEAPLFVPAIQSTLSIEVDMIQTDNSISVWQLVCKDNCAVPSGCEIILWHLGCSFYFKNYDQWFLCRRSMMEVKDKLNHDYWLRYFNCSQWCGEILFIKDVANGFIEETWASVSCTTCCPRIWQDKLRTYPCCVGVQYLKVKRYSQCHSLQKLQRSCAEKWCLPYYPLWN